MKRSQLYFVGTKLEIFNIINVVEASSSTSRSLRSTDVEIFLVGKCEKNITGVKLPSKRQVLQTLFHHLRIEKIILRRSARIVADEVLEF